MFHKYLIISNILCKVVLNDLLNNLSMMAGPCKKIVECVNFTFLISNILFRIVVNDVLNNLSMMVMTSLKLLEPCKKEIIEYDLEENI